MQMRGKVAKRFGDDINTDYIIPAFLLQESWDKQFFLDYLTVQQQLAAAIAAESQAIANYNIALASLEFAAPVGFSLLI